MGKLFLLVVGGNCWVMAWCRLDHLCRRLFSASIGGSFFVPISKINQHRQLNLVLYHNGAQGSDFIG